MRVLTVLGLALLVLSVVRLGHITLDVATYKIGIEAALNK